jgi:hypothetical protein
METIKETREEILFTDKIAGKGVVLTLWSDDVSKIEVFKHLCYANLPRSLSWFHQCNSRTYQMFEFWNPNLVTITMIAGQISAAMGIKLVADIADAKAIVRPQERIEIAEFQPFSEDMHSYDDLNG